MNAMTQGLNGLKSDGLSDLERFVNTSQSLRAAFSQNTAGKKAVFTGSFELQRPGQFRFHYTAPFEQLIVSDGKTLSIHDVDLNQVTQRKLGLASAFAPVLQVASAKDFAALNRVFDLKALPDAHGMSWASAAPKASAMGEAADLGQAGIASGAGTRVELGFRTVGNKPMLSQMVMVDSSGLRTTLNFAQVQTGVGFAPKHFSFTPPAGASVLAQ